MYSCAESSNSVQLFAKQAISLQPQQGILIFGDHPHIWGVHIPIINSAVYVMKYLQN